MPPVDSADDLLLVRRCCLGDAEAWRTLVERNAALLHAAVSRVVSATDVEDVLQGLFAKLWEDGRRRLASFEGKSRLSTWLVAVARREALDVVRARGAHDRAVASSASVLAVLNGHAPAVDAMAERREAEAALLAALDELPARDRLLVRLVHLDACPYREAARLLAVPENSIGPWLARARDRLEAVLATNERSTRTDSTPRVL